MFKIRNGIRANISDGVLHHPFELSICVMSFLSIWRMNDILINNQELLRRTEHGFLSMPQFILWMWVILGFIGTCLMMFGLAASIFSRKGRAIEAAGLWLVGSMWLSAGVASSAFGPSDFTEYGQYFAIFTACAIRIVALNEWQNVLRKIEKDEL